MSSIFTLSGHMADTATIPRRKPTDIEPVTVTVWRLTLYQKPWN